jgi:hypothetical protein
MDNRPAETKVAAVIADQDAREGFARELEAQMRKMVLDLEQMIEMHTRYGETLQKTYLYRARHALEDGLAWMDWERKRKHG